MLEVDGAQIASRCVRSILQSYSNLSEQQREDAAQESLALGQFRGTQGRECDSSSALLDLSEVNRSHVRLLEALVHRAHHLPPRGGARPPRAPNANGPEASVRVRQASGNKRRNERQSAFQYQAETAVSAVRRITNPLSPFDDSLCAASHADNRPQWHEVSSGRAIVSPMLVRWPLRAC